MLLLAATAANADPLTPQEVKEVERLVGMLGDPALAWRVEAHERLIRFGRRALPLLRELQPESAEARLRIQLILRSYSRLELTAELQSSRYALGAPVIVSLVLANHTPNGYMLPLEVALESRFRIRVGDQTRAVLASDVAYIEPKAPRGFVMLEPGEELRLKIAIRPEHLPRRAAGTYEMTVVYESGDVIKVDPADLGKGAMVQGDRQKTVLPSNRLVIDISTRGPAELEIALGDPKHRTRALIELQLREDDAVLPLLRKYAHDPDLRLHAIRRLGEKGDAADFDLLYKATKDPDAQVRVAGTVGLGNLELPKAGVKLAGLTRDHELRLHAVRALTKHKSARTIQAYIDVLNATYREGPWVPIIQKALKDWTGITVRNTPGEIRAFQRWWAANRDEWIRKN